MSSDEPFRWTEQAESTYLRLRGQGRSCAYIARVIGATESDVRMFGMYRRKLKHKSAESLCWRCRNSVPNPETGDGCPWSRRFEPVEGWTAFPRQYTEHTGNHGISYQVSACPLFKEEK